MNRLSIFIVAAFVLGSSSPLIAQTQSAHEEDDRGSHKFTVGIGHTYLAEKTAEVKSLISAYLLNYDYILSKRWSVGTHNDILFENSVAGLHANGEEAVEHPVVTKLIGAYSPVKNGHLLFGLGDEIKGSENHLLINIGLDYGVRIADGWELAGEVSLDNKFHGSDGWLVGIGICRTIRKHH